MLTPLASYSSERILTASDAADSDVLSQNVDDVVANVLALVPEGANLKPLKVLPLSKTLVRCDILENGVRVMLTSRNKQVAIKADVSAEVPNA